MSITGDSVTHAQAYTGAFARWLRSVLNSIGLSEEYVDIARLIILLAFLAVAVYVVLFVASRLIRFFIKRASKISNIQILDYLIHNKVPYYIGLLAPYALVRNTISIIFVDYPDWISPLIKCVDIYLILLVIWTVVAFIKSLFNMLQERPAFANKPLHTYTQVITMILYGMGIIIAFAIITNTSTLKVLTTLGAASAVLMLVFQDSIKGFVGSIQMSANNMVELGDWITMPKYNADGTVLEVNLNTVKVQNFDKTITTIPTYALISDSFQNWRGMQASGGRRTKKSIYVKQASIRFMKEEELETFRKIPCLKAVIEEKEAANTAMDRMLIGGAVPVTNNDLFMAYSMNYLRNHKNVAQELTLLVRQLAPSEKGIPVEMYFFTSTTVWAAYEGISSEIMNHLISMVPVFDLQIFELLSDSPQMGGKKIIKE